ncbi:hypothetical protein GKQ38_00995 [Candidatus Nanohaloarchaea archaeon]|nr:hypothetical protein GKQ38_00995 [Candidatus Nanohaloarchaea archaeon]
MDVEELGRLWGSLDDIENYTYREVHDNDKPDFEGLKEGFNDLEDLNRLKAALVMLRQKKGASITQKFDSKNSLEEFADFLSEQGLHVWTGVGLEEDDFVYAEVFLSYRSRPKGFFDSYQDMRDKRPAQYHRKMGEFFGYPEESIEAFLRKPSLLQRAREFLAYHLGLSLERQNINGVKESIEKYGDDLSDRQKKDVRTLIFYMLDDSEQAFNCAVETAEARRESLEELRDEEDVDFTGLQESYAEMLDGFGE